VQVVHLFNLQPQLLPAKLGVCVPAAVALVLHMAAKDAEVIVVVFVE
jgi:hypothetical protein